MLVTSFGSMRSRHCVYDDSGWWGEVILFEYGFRFRLSHRWSGRVRLDWACSAASPTWRRLMPDWRFHVSQFVRRFEAGEREAAMAPKAVDKALAARRPALHEYLTLDWLEGQLRITSTVSISISNGSWRVRLADRENGLVCFVTGESFEGALDALEKVLAAGTADWRVDEYAPAKPSKKRR